MSEIIKISSEVIGTEKVNSVNARELHQVLAKEKKLQKVKRCETILYK